MGNSRSQPCRRSRPSYLFYLIQRTWIGKPVEPADKEDPDESADRQSEVSSSRCSDCKSCHYRQDSLTFDSESEMAPNAEEELLAVKPWGPQPEKERLRPPTYNAEDYAIALRRWGRRPVVASHESHGTLPSTTSSSSGYASGCGEMTLRQFTSVSELLNKLRADLRLAFPSFVQEFASPPADGMTLLLETLRGVQLIQSSPPSGQGGPRIGTRRAALDELGCVECLAACGERCPDAPRLLSQAQPGLLALAVCLTSSLNRSRVLALQLLTKVCQAPGGHLAVSEAVSTLRLRYGEGGRFRFLAGALLAPRAATALRVAGMSFLNAFLKSAPRSQTRLYIQAEACEAGLEPRVVQSWLTEVDVRGDDSLSELLHKEIQKWSHNCVDVEALQKRLARAEETCAILGNKVSILQEQLSKYNLPSKTSGYGGSSDQERKTKSSLSMSEDGKMNLQKCTSSNAEDEGISSSERSSSPEELERGMRRVENDAKMSCIDNDQETTIDDVIEELRIIVKDAEEEYEDRKVRPSKIFPGSAKDVCSSISDKQPASTRLSINRQPSSTNDDATHPVTYFGPNEDEELSVDSAITRKLSSACSEKTATKADQDGSLKIIVKSPEFEDAIVPAILYPQPPRRAPPCLSTILATRDQPDFLDNPIVFNDHQDEEDIEEETLDDGSDSLLSASRLKYVTKNDGLSNLTNDLETRQFYNTDLHTPHRSIDDTPDDNPAPKEPRENGNLQREPKTIRNFDNVTNIKNLEDTDLTRKYFHIYKQFESGGKVITDNLTTVQKRLPARYKSDTEKRKLLRRSASQDFLGSTGSSSGKSRIEGRIRKFESLNAFENASMARLDGVGSIESSEKALRNGGSRMKRSESFHHVSIAGRDSSERCDEAGSDSGLLYITDYDLEPLVNRKNTRDGFPQFSNYLTKSLDRIDEAHDTSFVNNSLSPKRAQTARSSKDKNEKKFPEKTSKNKIAASKGFAKQKAERAERDETRGGDDPRESLGHLRNDEMYDDETERSERAWNFKVDSEDRTAIKNFAGNVTTMTIGGCNQNGQRRDKIATKFSINDPGGFLPSGRYDAFGMGKSRFNAGKYSGHSQSSRDADAVGARRHSNASLVAKRGKVTDILSGLY